MTSSDDDVRRNGVVSEFIDGDMQCLWTSSYRRMNWQILVPHKKCSSSKKSEKSEMRSTTGPQQHSVSTLLPVPRGRIRGQFPPPPRVLPARGAGLQTTATGGISTHRAAQRYPLSFHLCSSGERCSRAGNRGLSLYKLLDKSKSNISLRSESGGKIWIWIWWLVWFEVITENIQSGIIPSDADGCAEMRTVRVEHDYICK